MSAFGKSKRGSNVTTEAAPRLQKKAPPNMLPATQKRVAHHITPWETPHSMPSNARVSAGTPAPTPLLRRARVAKTGDGWETFVGDGGARADRPEGRGGGEGGSSGQETEEAEPDD